jgi:hypothetical protein
VGCNVDPLGEVLIRLFPDGFTLLFAPAAALPAPLPRPPFAPLVEVPVVVPAVVDLVVVPPAAGAELPAAEPVPLCASANVLASVSAAAKPMLVNLMVCFLSLVKKEKLPRPDMFRIEASTVCGDPGTARTGSEPTPSPASLPRRSRNQFYSVAIDPP